MTKYPSVLQLDLDSAQIFQDILLEEFLAHWSQNLECDQLEYLLTSESVVTTVAWQGPEKWEYNLNRDWIDKIVSNDKRVIFNVY